MATVERSVLRIDRPEVQQGMTPEHRVRPLMPAAMRGDFAATDPFLALMEDWFPRGVFGKHPHRGIDTVTYVVEGRIHHYDNQGHEGTILPGDVQWMTAGRGLIHSEIPAESVTEGRLSTYCGRTRPPPWTPQLGGNLPLHGDHWTAELLDVHRRFAMSALTSTPAVPSALFAVVPQWRVRMGQVDALRKVVDRARHTWPLSGSLD